MKKRLGILTLLISYLLTLLYKINDFGLHLGEETVNVNTSVSLIFRNLNNSSQPLLGNTIWSTFVKVVWLFLGQDYPFLWRIVTISFSVGCLVIFQRIAKLIFSTNIANFATFILALDPLYFVFSRTANPEVISIFFFLIAFYLLLSYLENSKQKYITVSSVFLGLTMAVRISPLIALNFVIALLYPKKIIQTLVFFLIGFIVGNSIFFTVNHKLTFQQFTSNIASSYIKQSYIINQFQSPPLTWFSIPQVVKFYRVIYPTSVSLVMGFQNPLTMVLVFPAILVLIFSWKYLEDQIKILLLTFLAICFLISFGLIPPYYQNVIILIPLEILLEIAGLTTIIKRQHTFKIIKLVSLLWTLLIFAVYYPALVGIPIPKSLNKILEWYSVYHTEQSNSLYCQKC